MGEIQVLSGVWSWIQINFKHGRTSQFKDTQNCVDLSESLNISQITTAWDKECVCTHVFFSLYWTLENWNGLVWSGMYLQQPKAIKGSRNTVQTFFIHVFIFISDILTCPVQLHCKAFSNSALTPSDQTPSWSNFQKKKDFVKF